MHVYDDDTDIMELNMAAFLIQPPKWLGTTQGPAFKRKEQITYTQCLGYLSITVWYLMSLFCD